MTHKIQQSAQWGAPIIIGSFLLALFVFANPASAITALPTPAPKPGSYGLAATKLQAAPTVAASISTPGNGASYSTSPITVNGICTTGLLVQVYDNNVLVGSVVCENGSFSLQVSLFAGVNELSAIVYDDLDQAGPVSNLVTVTYSDTSFTAFGELVTLTTSYGRRSAPAGNELTWPLQLSGGTGPYAFSIDWGDGVASDLKSQASAGLVTILHTYKKAGIYQVNVKVTDTNGVSAFLQVVALGNGKVDSEPAAANETKEPAPKVIWIPAAIAVVLMLPAFWFGRQSQIVSLRHKLLKQQEENKEK